MPLHSRRRVVDAVGHLHDLLRQLRALGIVLHLGELVADLAELDAGRVESVCIAATQLATGRAVVFCQQKGRALPPWASQANIRMQPIRLSPVHALASAAIRTHASHRMHLPGS